MITPKQIQVEKTLKELFKDIEKFGIDIVKHQLNYYVKEINEFNDCSTMQLPSSTCYIGTSQITGANTTLTHPYFPTFLE